MLSVIKNSVRTNLSYIDKVIVVCSGRIEMKHQQAIQKFLKWLQYSDYKENFVFVYNKSDGLSEATKLTNLQFMCETFGVDTKNQAEWAGNLKEILEGKSNKIVWHAIDQNLALGFPPGQDYETVQKDHKQLMRATFAVPPRDEKRIPVMKGSSCTIL